MLMSFSWDNLFDSMVPVYQKHLTKGDLDALVTFYGTTTGQKILRELPQTTAEAMQQMMPLLRTSMEDMQKGLQQDIAAMLKESHSKSDTQPCTEKQLAEEFDPILGSERPHPSELSASRT
jgi:Uncharacterized protein conserved in bacteria (DUF2059)